MKKAKGAKNAGVLRRPKTTNEKRQNEALDQLKDEAELPIKGRKRTGKTSSRLADIRDDVLVPQRPFRKRDKPSHALARDAKERSRS